MLQYVNAFSCSFNRDTKELILKFQQIEPNMQSEGSDTQITSFVTNDVAPVIMNLNTAQHLQDLLGQVLNDEIDTPT